MDQTADPKVLEEGAVVLHEMPDRKITLHPGNIVKKSGMDIGLQEADALRVAESAGLPVPHVHNAATFPDGEKCITRTYIDGQTLSDVWTGLAEQEKQRISNQLRDILETMRSIPAPDSYVGDCSFKQVRDARLDSTHTGDSRGDEEEFNSFLLESFLLAMPLPLGRALFERLQTDHRIVFTHADLSPGNIIVKDGSVVGIIDWEDAGWYPEYWEYVKFFQRATSSDGDWRDYADDIFPVSYPDELVDYVALSEWKSL